MPVLGDKPLEGEVGLTSPLGSVKEVILPLKLSLPFVFTRVLAHDGKPSIPSIAITLIRFEG